jgi:hypothetical protein
MREAIQQGFAFDAPLFAVQGPKAAEVPPVPVVQVPAPEPVFRVQFMGGIDLGTVGGPKAAPAEVQGPGADPEDATVGGPVWKRRGPLVVRVKSSCYAYPLRPTDRVACVCGAGLQDAEPSEGGSFLHCPDCGEAYPIVPLKG